MRLWVLDRIFNRNAAGAIINPATTEDIVDLRDQLLASLDAVRLAIINEVDALQAALLAALADVEAAIAAADLANVAAVQDARDQLLAAIAALQAANNVSGDDIVAAVQAAQAALEAALLSVQTAITTEGGETQAALASLEATLVASTTTLDTSLDNIEIAVVAEGDQTQVLLATVASAVDNARTAIVAALGLMVWDPDAVAFARIIGNESGGILVNNRMPSKAPGATKVRYTGAPLTTSQTLFSPGENGWAVGEAFHLAEQLISGFNIETGPSGYTHYRLRDGAAGTIWYEEIHSQAQGTLGSVPHEFGEPIHYEEHPVFLNEVYFEIVSGDLTTAVCLHGYSVAP